MHSPLGRLLVLILCRDSTITLWFFTTPAQFGVVRLGFIVGNRTFPIPVT